MVRMVRKCSSNTLIVFIILIASLWLLSCSSSRTASVSDRSTQKIPANQIHTVVRGDTLFSIAWRYGLDYKELARFNGISSAYSIYPGQKISLNIAGVRDKSGSANITESSSVKSPAGVADAQNKAGNRSNNQTNHGSKSSVNGNFSSAIKWQWPGTGNLVALFEGDSGVNKGIDLGGNLGESVLAAASGQVVYAGSGLRGYGKLLIIKHNEVFLSAYAHNSEILVKEGDLVKAGQRIADMGSSGTDRVKLHFEIRSDGKPVDPLKFLPKR